MATYDPPDEFFTSSVLEVIPVPMLLAKGQVEFRTWATLGDDPLRICPSALTDRVARLLERKSPVSKSGEILAAWIGEEALIVPNILHMRWLPLESALHATRLILEQRYHLAEIDFLESPWPGLPPLVQEVWHRGAAKSERPPAELMAAAIDDPLGLSAHDRAVVAGHIEGVRGRYFIPFPRGTEQLFRAARIYNLANPLGTLVFRAAAHLSMSPPEQQKRDSALGRLQDALEKVISNPVQGRHSKTPEVSDGAVADLIEIAAALGLRIEPAISGSDALVWDHDADDLMIRNDREAPRPFGRPIQA
jgi:hypothetical protein